MIIALAVGIALIVGLVSGYAASSGGFEQLRRIVPQLVRGAAFPLLVVASSVGLLVAVVWLVKELDGNKEMWSQVIAAVSLFVVTWLIYGTGEHTYTAKQDIGERATPPPGENRDPAADEEESGEQAPPEPKYRVGDRLEKTQFDDLSPADKAKVERQRGLYFRALYVGADGRWSTSKLQLLLWTYAILYALIALFVASDLGLRFGEKGDQKFGDLDLDPDYLLLLGGPFAAAVVAKGITSSKVESGEVAKPPEPNEQGPGEGLREVVSNDRKESDLVDFQYFFFNAAALFFFFITFVPNMEDGLPEIPTFLAALTGGAALAYLGKKAVERATPTISVVVPSRARPCDWVRVEGFNLLASPELLPTVSVDGRAAKAELIHSPRRRGDSTVLRVQVPPSARAGEGCKLVVTPQGSTAGAEANIEVIETKIESVEPPSLRWNHEAHLFLTGIGFGRRPAPGKGQVALGDLSLDVVEWRDGRIVVALPDALPDQPPAETLRLRVTNEGMPLQETEVTIAPS